MSQLPQWFRDSLVASQLRAYDHRGLLRKPDAKPDDQFRKEFCGMFNEPEERCPNCTTGTLRLDVRHRGVRCISCGYKSWERGPVYIGVDHASGSDHSAVVIGHMDGTRAVVDLVVSRPTEGATP